jgi:hypothetical protein
MRFSRSSIRIFAASPTLRQHLHFCTSKASKVSTSVLWCTSKASKVSTSVLHANAARHESVAAQQGANYQPDVYARRIPVARVCQRLRHTSAYFRGIRQHTSPHTGRAHLSAPVTIPHHTSAYVSLFQHTSAYVSIFQHTSAYVSIFQHTSAYFSIL